MNKLQKLIFFIISTGLVLSHGISDSDKTQITEGSLMDYMYLGAKHMITDMIIFCFLLVFFFFYHAILIFLSLLLHLQLHIA